MKIACIAWGSLIWKAGQLPVAGAWQLNGPRLPLEFARVGNDGEMAVVLCADAPEQPTRWALLDVKDIEQARELLRQREQAPPEHPEWIGSLPSAGWETPHDAVILAWLRTQGLDGCVWTGLPPRAGTLDGRKPTAEDVVAYLGGLKGKTRAHAQDYVQRVPAEISTPYRQVIESKFGWIAQTHSVAVKP